MHPYCRQLVFVLIIVSGSSANYSAKAEILEAQWEVYQVRFRYVGFSTHYTCDGVERTLRRLLLLMGARDDARVETSCTNHSTVQRFHRVKLAFAMPVPADRTDISREVIPAEWQKVRIIGKLSRYLDAGDCELVEQFQRYVLPHLQVRSSGRKLRCTPNRREYNSFRLNVVALKALEKTELEEGLDKMFENISQPDEQR